MKVAVIGTRRVPDTIAAHILAYLPASTTELVSGGAEGVDRAAEEIASSLSLPIRRFLPDYGRYGRRAPLMRNLEIIAYADEVLAFWDGASRGTMHSIAECIRLGKPVRVVPLSTLYPAGSVLAGPSGEDTDGGTPNSPSHARERLEQEKP
ncbi:MAG TPA: hypothetical protein H9674_02295 [Firmicutes bacterium]|nr:hypothetical protein [Bacillota bacterium]